MDLIGIHLGRWIKTYETPYYLRGKNIHKSRLFAGWLPGFNDPQKATNQSGRSMFQVMGNHSNRYVTIKQHYIWVNKVVIDGLNLVSLFVSLTGNALL